MQRERLKSGKCRMSIKMFYTLTETVGTTCLKIRVSLRVLFELHKAVGSRSLNAMLGQQ